MKKNSKSCVDEILENHRQQSHPRSGKNGREEQIFRFLVQLMQDCPHEREYPEHVQDCLLLILNLFLVRVPDRYHGRGKSLADLSGRERKEMKKLLRKALI